MSAKGNKTRLIKKASKKNKKNKKRKITRSKIGTFKKREIIHKILNYVLKIGAKTKYSLHSVNAQLSEEQSEEFDRELALAEDRCVEYLNDPKNFTQNISQIECEKKFRRRVIKFIDVYYPDFPLWLRSFLQTNKEQSIPVDI